MVCCPPMSSHQGLSRSERFGGLVLSEIMHPAGSRIGWHCHELAAFALTLRGSSTETFTNTAFERTEHSLLVRPAGERHRDSVDNHGAKCFLIEVTGAFLNGLPQFETCLQSPSLHHADTITRLAQRAYREWLLKDTASPIAIQALTLEIASHLIREEASRSIPEPPPWLRRVKQRLDESLTETLSLAELATIGSVHPTHLCRHFRRHYGATVGEYLRKRRVDRAIELLSRTRLLLTEIALESGFSSHGHFCTIFRRVTGMTPGEFRKLSR
jgi:AraC family transcriptional regulator